MKKITWTDLQHHDRHIEALKTLSLRKNIHHAHLFYGKSDHQVLMTAWIFIMTHLCLADSSDAIAKPCYSCESCMAIQGFNPQIVQFLLPTTADKKMNHFQYFRELIEEKSLSVSLEDYRSYLSSHLGKSGTEKINLKIRAEQLASFFDFIEMSSLSNGFKVQFIWMAEMLEAESNKILKILEEPPAKTIYILIAERIDRLLPTIISRCQLHQIHSPDPDKFIRLVPSSLEKEDIRQYFKLFGSNLSIMTDIALPADKSLWILTQKYLSAIAKFQNKNFQEAIKAMQIISQIDALTIDEQNNILRYMLDFLAHVLKMKYGKLSFEEKPYFKIINFYSLRIELDQIGYMREVIEKTYQNLQQNVNSKISFVYLYVELGQSMLRTLFEEKMNKIA
ncbi:MAG: hypothetical protein MUE53_02890 [Chitinophagales bacterium]|jgi:DNA polymerase-3 subunit delta'|nr:hypothetical protein [Chitinophagales bacterium]